MRHNPLAAFVESNGWPDESLPEDHDELIEGLIAHRWTVAAMRRWPVCLGNELARIAALMIMQSPEHKAWEAEQQKIDGGFQLEPEKD